MTFLYVLCYFCPPYYISGGFTQRGRAQAHDLFVGTHAKHVLPRLVSVASPTQAAAAHTRTMCSPIVPMKAPRYLNQ